MKIFLSYASEDRSVAEPINLALLAQGHDVFFDRDDLQPGAEYDNRVRRAIEDADLFVFLVSGKSIQASRYTLSELGIAQRRWKHPDGRVLPVMIEAFAVAQLPAYLRSVTLLEPQGNVTAGVAEAVSRIAAARRSGLRRRLALAGGVLLIAGVALALLFPRGPRTQTQHADGSVGVLIPGGRFVLGDDEHAPLREVFLDAFRIDRDEITTAQYAKFLQAAGSSQRPDHWDQADTAGSKPVIGITWHEAQAYCTWAGRRLPTDAEWEAAARGSDERRHPWGNEAPDATRARFAIGAEHPYRDGLAAAGTHPAGASAHGVHDLAGNASEWVADWYAEGISRSQTHNPRGPEAGEAKVIRGGGFYDAAARLFSAQRFHADPSTRGEDIGFRCAVSAR
jgi:formylglycine-generating enzyme required for sulfatase activity